MEILATASILAAFVAGLAALFAPCCITVLLPAYLGSIFREKRKVFIMTFVFFLGLLTIFLPLGLGLGGLGQLFSKYHNSIFLIGGTLLVLLGTFILLGGHFSLPIKSSNSMKLKSAHSVYFLGIFSGFATLCCAPVLAGALALSVLPGSIMWGGIYTLSYVLGMVVPLFFMAYFIEKTSLTEKIFVLKKEIHYKLGSKEVSLALSDLISGITFLAMGMLIFYLSMTNNLTSHSSYQTDMNIFMSNITETIGKYLGGVPVAILIIAVVLLLGAIVKMAADRIKKE